jgi:transcriptional regulator with XRE-family HTH domain
MQKLDIHDSGDFGRIIRARRKALGYTQNQVVDLAPFGSTFFSDLENGKESAQLNKALEAARMLGLRVVIESPMDLDVQLYSYAGIADQEAM